MKGSLILFFHCFENYHNKIRQFVFVLVKVLSDENGIDYHHRFFVPLDKLQNWLEF